MQSPDTDGCAPLFILALLIIVMGGACFMGGWIHGRISTIDQAVQAQCGAYVADPATGHVTWTWRPTPLPTEAP